jgi:hypothetical protein
MSCLARGAVCAITLAASCAAQPSGRFQVTAPMTILSAGDMQRFGLLFPDTSIGFVRSADGRYLAFAAGGSFGGIGPGPSVSPIGAYRFVGTLDHLSPAGAQGRSPTPVLTNGRRQRSPDAADFDQDYGGGGPTYPLGDGSSLMQIYHGERRCAPEAGIPAVGGMGLAISRDGGASFAKLGEILTPHVKGQDFCRSGRRGGLWADGSMVAADAEGRRAADNAYEYILFVDHNALPEPDIGISIARVSRAEMLGAIAAGRAPKFLKYYNPNRAAGPRGSYFTEPGVGGASTPVFIPGGYVGTPSVYFDDDLGQFLICYQTNQKRIAVATSHDLFTWSEPSTVVEIPQEASDHLYYPSAVGTGIDPLILGKHFYIYYLQRTPPNTDPRLLRVTLTSQ